ncbi:hypothetical protein GXP70_07410 [Paenibacillus lycopersici]|uniref:Beta-galactosidase trimerisation domain-containing protein n=1 Tax=Paenibacillus lycopersici TaxID=2704462 RepID=A0A6C0FRN2_9BACL|nr:hypothetical protein [Paenibacillus lycopersici]QHT59798.1 hypothetical protein GXP70_07410 [Paenibacillus lycopersici]
MYSKMTIQDYAEPPHIKPGDVFTYDFVLDDSDFIADHDFKLMLKGEYAMHPSWMTEAGYPYLYRMIDDCLCPIDTHHSQFYLRFKGNGEAYRKRAYYKFVKPEHAGNRFTFSIYAKAEQLIKNTDAELDIVFEKRWIKEGVNKASISLDPDEVIVIPIEEGTYPWSKIEKDFVLEDHVASVLVYIHVKGCTGDLYLEDPYLQGNFYCEPGYNYLPQFTMFNPFHEDMNWLGENLSKKEWANLQIAINDEVCFDGEFFQRSLRFTEKEIKIDQALLKAGKNTISITNQADHFMPHPYRVKSLYLLYKEAKNLTVVGYNDCIPLHTPIPVLIYLKQASTVTVSGNENLVFDQVHECKKGFNVINFTATAHQTNVDIGLRCGLEEETITIIRTLVKQDDNVLTGTSDAIYIAQDMEEFDEYFCWYINNRLGNFITLRPVYRWSGTRELNAGFWSHVVDLFTELRYHYCHIIDGRELPGMNANPTRAMLEGPYFVGNQGHERDGAFYYWGIRRGEKFAFFDELMERFINKIEDGKYLTPPVYARNRVFANYDPVKPADMEEAANQLVDNVRYSLNGMKRHSGPSTLFKYFYEGGVESAGSELMYGPHEIIIAAQRGAAIAYNKKDLLAHLAVQWSTLPHDTEERFRRYRLSLFVCYTHNINHINTEEGLMHIESELAFFDRFSPACLGHLEVQQNFAHFVTTHTRPTNMVVPFGFLHGKNDAWVCFTRPNAWGQIGDQWKFDHMEESWDLLKVFFPDAVLNAIYRYPCENKPQGFYSRTPYGTVDILPIEAQQAAYQNYKVLAFLGYNTATEQQFKQILAFCENGGTAILTWAHLFTTTDRNEALTGTSGFIEKGLTERLLGIQDYTFPAYNEDPKRMAELTLQDTAAVVQTHHDKALIIQNSVGKGKVIFMNSLHYPANPAIRDEYEAVLKQAAEEASKAEYEKGYIVSDDTVNFTVFDREDGLRVIYLLNIDWWSDKEIAKATLKWNNHSFEINIERDKINMITLSKSIGILTRDMDTEVVSIRESNGDATVRLQGYGTTSIEVITMNDVREETISINGFYERTY